MIKIKYVGRRESYTDGCYGSHITFKKGEVLAVEDHIAAKFLKHPDVYIRAEETELGKPVITPAEKPVIEEDPDQEALDSLEFMTKQELIDFARDNFAGIQINKQENLSEMKAKVTMYIGQYGIGESQHSES